MAFKLYTDNNCDLPFEYTSKHEITVLPVIVSIGGKSYSLNNDPNAPETLDTHWFYDQLRAGIPASTAQTTKEVYIEAFEPDLKEGLDVLYLAFSSGLSASYSGAVLAKRDLEEKYPGRVVCVVDTLCASLGMGLLVHLVNEKREQGASLQELEAYANELIPHMHHWFTVDDLHHLRRGGRVSGASAVIGTMLSIKPVLNVDEEGHLIPREKVQGRKRAMKSLVDHMEQFCSDPKKYPVFLSHGDCEGEARLVAKMIKDRFGVDVAMINPISPIIGSHSGPGTIALFYVADQASADKPRG